MGTRWQQLHGDTARFAISFAFEDDPDEGRGATPEMAASWGRFGIWVRGENLCARMEAGELVTGVHWYLLPLLESVAAHWQPLLHEEKLPVSNAAATACEALRLIALRATRALDDDASPAWAAGWSAWRDRHALEAWRDGGLFPNVVLRRFRDRVEVSWGPARLAGAPPEFRFLSSEGVARLDPRDVAQPLYDGLRAAVAFLASEQPRSARVERLVSSVEAIRSPLPDERLAWMVGLGRDREEMSDRWSRAKERLTATVPGAADALWGGLGGDLVAVGSCQVALMFGSASPTLVEKDVLELASLAVRQYRPDVSCEPGALAPLVRAEPAPSDPGRAWQQGYDLALEFIEEAVSQTRKAPQTNMDGVLRRIGIDVVRLELADSQIRGVAIAGPMHRPLIAWNSAHPWNARTPGRRFTLAHELCHILHDRTAARELSLTSGPWAPRNIERRANAFAAMLLMPVDRVKAVISRLPVSAASADGIRAIATAFGTSNTATLEHVGNLDQWDDATRDRVKAEFDDAGSG